MWKRRQQCINVPKRTRTDFDDGFLRGITTGGGAACAIYISVRSFVFGGWFISGNIAAFATLLRSIAQSHVMWWIGAFAMSACGLFGAFMLLMFALDATGLLGD